MFSTLVSRLALCSAYLSDTSGHRSFVKSEWAVVHSSC